jgi:hypothetical protein
MVLVGCASLSPLDDRDDPHDHARSPGKGGGSARPDRNLLNEFQEQQTLKRFDPFIQ